MPEAPTNVRPGVVALALMVSAIGLGVLSLLIYNGFLPLGKAAALVVGVAAFTDLLIGVVFFRKGQSS